MRIFTVYFSLEGRQAYTKKPGSKERKGKRRKARFFLIGLVTYFLLISNQIKSGKFMVSFDVESLFTSIPLDECIDIAIRYIYQGNPGLKINAADLRRLFAFATAETGFLFAGVFYDQIDGVAMGSPLAPVLANLFMGHHEKTWLDNYSLSEVVFYRRYVDDTFCLFNNEKDAVLFFDYLNTRHPSIRFTMEKEINEKLSFLDILIDNSNPSIITSVYRKKTFTGLLTNYFSFTPMMYKLGLIRTLVDRVYKINNSWVGFHKDVQKLIFLLRKNCFPSSVIDRIISRHLAKSYNPSPTHNATLNSGNPSSHYFKLPYVGRFSDIAQTKLRHLLKRFSRSFKTQSCILVTSSKGNWNYIPASHYILF